MAILTAKNWAGTTSADPFTLRMWNPCTNPDLYEIQVLDGDYQTEFEYQIGSEALEIRVSDVPFTCSLDFCGPISKTVSIEATGGADEAVSPTSDNEEEVNYIVYTDDSGLVNK